MFRIMLFPLPAALGEEMRCAGLWLWRLPRAQLGGSVPAGAAQGVLSQAPGGAGADGQEFSQDRRRWLRHGHGGRAGTARSRVWVAGAASLSPGLHRHSSSPRSAAQAAAQQLQLREADVPRCQARADVNMLNKTVPVRFPARANGFELCNVGRG